mmetsp:Transcript_3802/g.7087  ORF Transcript_3802/g.7087 Transcript_3802/m.7087 type:complete len:396 (-) Transcript_3802:38-1225(-)
MPRADSAMLGHRAPSTACLRRRPGRASRSRSSFRRPSLPLLFFAALLFRPTAPITVRFPGDEDGRDAEALRGASSTSSSVSSSASPLLSTPPLSTILSLAASRALGGGIPGAAAGLVQVLTLMWLRTIVNYQYRYGTTMVRAARTLHAQGGWRRFYSGVEFAVLQGPLARFGSTAANDGVNALLAAIAPRWGPGRATAIAGIAVGLWRVVLMPIDTAKTVLQVDGKEGFRALVRKVRGGKVGVLYQGALVNAVSSATAHYPFFYTFNFLSQNDKVTKLLSHRSLLRHAVCGFIASAISDAVSNSLRVIKTTKQAIGTKHTVGYGEAISMVLAADGWKGLFGRGLITKILANGLQAMIFTVVWKGMQEKFFDQNKENEAETTKKKDSEKATEKTRH